MMPGPLKPQCRPYCAGLAVIHRKPRISKPYPEHRTLLKNMTINLRIWCADIMRVPMRRGFVSLVAIYNRASRKVLGVGQLSNTLDKRC